MKKLIVSSAVTFVLLLTATCSSPNIIHSGKFYYKDTICIATEPGYTYEIRIIPESPKAKPIDEVQVSTSSDGPFEIKPQTPPNVMDHEIIFRPMQDTVHIFYTETGNYLFIDCNTGETITYPCNGDEIEIECIPGTIEKCAGSLPESGWE